MWVKIILFCIFVVWNSLHSNDIRIWLLFARRIRSRRFLCVIICGSMVFVIGWIIRVFLAIRILCCASIARACLSTVAFGMDIMVASTSGCRRRIRTFGRRRSGVTKSGTRKSNGNWQRWDGTVSQCGSASWSQTREKKHWLLLPLRWTISIYRTAPLLIQGLKKRASWSRQLNRSLTRRAVCRRQFNVLNPPYWWGKTTDKIRWDLRCQCCNAKEKDLLQGSEWSCATWEKAFC